MFFNINCFLPLHYTLILLLKHLVVSADIHCFFSSFHLFDFSTDMTDKYMRMTLAWFWVCVFAVLVHSNFSFFVENRLNNVKYFTYEKVYTDPKATWSLDTFKKYFQTDKLTVERTPDVIKIRYTRPYTAEMEDSTLPQFIDDDMSGQTDEQSPDDFPPVKLMKYLGMDIYPENVVKYHTCEFEFFKKPLFLTGLLEMFVFTSCVVVFFRNYGNITPILATNLVTFVNIVIAAVVSGSIAIDMLSSVDRIVCSKVSPQQSQYIFESTNLISIFGIALVLISITVMLMQLYCPSINRGPFQESIPVADSPSFGGANSPSFGGANSPSFGGADSPSFGGAVVLVIEEPGLNESTV